MVKYIQKKVSTHTQYNKLNKTTNENQWDRIISDV